MVTLHSKILLSSTKPAEKPSTGCLQRSAKKKGLIRRSQKESKSKEEKKKVIIIVIITFELFLKEKAGLGRHEIKNVWKPTV